MPCRRPMSLQRPQTWQPEMRRIWWPSIMSTQRTQSSPPMSMQLPQTWQPAMQPFWLRRIMFMQLTQSLQPTSLRQRRTSEPWMSGRFRTLRIWQSQTLLRARIIGSLEFLKSAAQIFRGICPVLSVTSIRTQLVRWEIRVRLTHYFRGRHKLQTRLFSQLLIRLQLRFWQQISYGYTSEQFTWASPDHTHSWQIQMMPVTSSSIIQVLWIQDIPPETQHLLRRTTGRTARVVVVHQVPSHSPSGSIRWCIVLCKGEVDTVRPCFGHHRPAYLQLSPQPTTFIKPQVVRI